MSAQESVKFEQTRVLFSSPSDLTTLLQRSARGWTVFFLILSDLAGLSCTVALSLALQRYVLMSSPNPLVLEELLILPLVFVIISFTSGLYPAFGLNAVEELRRQTMATSLVFLSLIGLTFITKSSLVFSRFLFISCWTMSLVLLPLFRGFLRFVLRQFKDWGEPVAVIGPHENAAEIAAYLRINNSIGLLPVAVFDDHKKRKSAESIPLLPLRELEGFCIANRIESAVVVHSSAERIFNTLDIYDDVFKRVVFIPVSENPRWLSGINVMEYGDLVGFEKKHNLLDKVSQFYKRVIDLAVSLAGIILLMPFFIAVTCVLWLDSPGRIFYRQTRIGKDGRRFTMVKFRTMELNADQVLRDFLDKNPDQKKEWEQFQKLKFDPRITRFGRLMRRFSIDEFPQLWNVLKGEMSLVGPRPILPAQHERYGRPYSLYRKVNPGITGLWQISGRASTSFKRRVEFDKVYVMNWSIWLDILILVKTFWVVVRQKGAY